LGALCAMMAVLEKMGKSYTGFVGEKIAKNFLFLPFIEKISPYYGEISSYDLIISLDAAALKRIDIKEIAEYRDKIINIDHHFSGEEFGYLNIKNSFASATTEILANIFKSTKIEIDKQIATCLLTGVLTDTHNFSNPATTISSLKVASDLMLSGAKIRDIVKYCFYNKSFLSVKFLGKIFDKLVINKKYSIAIAVVTVKDFEDIAGIDGEDEDLTDGLADFLNDLSGVNVILVLKEHIGELKGSFRTTKQGIDVSNLAKMFGGGGHKKAAGFSMKGQILQDNNRWRVV